MTSVSTSNFSLKIDKNGFFIESSKKVQIFQAIDNIFQTKFYYSLRNQFFIGWPIFMYFDEKMARFFEFP